MAIQNSDLLLVQRGSVPQKAEASLFATYVKDKVDASDIQIASAAQLGVIRVGQNLQIDAVTGVLDAVIPAGTEFQGIWIDANNPPSQGNAGGGLVNGMFWIWDGGNATLNNPSWGNANGTAVSNGDFIYYDGTTFDAVPSGSGGLQNVTGALPITVDNSDPAHPEIGINQASSSQDGYISASDYDKLDSIEPGAEVNVYQNLKYTPSATNGLVEISDGTDATIPTATAAVAGLMSANDKTVLDNLVSSPGGVLSVIGGDGIAVDASNAGAPVVSAVFGNTPNGSPVTIMPYDISMLAELT